MGERKATTGGIEHERMDRKHVLAVNGDPLFLDLIRELLQEEQYNVTTTNYVPKTFDLIACLQPSLLIVDLVIGEAAGWELLGHLQREAITRGIPVFATSTMQHLLIAPWPIRSDMDTTSTSSSHLTWMS
ncbi:MAG: response regulator [Thermomicrobiales bacterium]